MSDDVARNPGRTENVPLLNHRIPTVSSEALESSIIHTQYCLVLDEGESPT